MDKPVFLSKIVLAACIPALLTSCISVKPYIAANAPGVAPKVHAECHSLASWASLTLDNNVTITTTGYLSPGHATSPNAGGSGPSISITLYVSSKKTREANSVLRGSVPRLPETTRFSSNDVVISPLNASAVTVGFDEKHSNASGGYYNINLTGDRALWPEFNLTLPTIVTPEGTYPGPAFHYKHDKKLFFDGCEA